MLGLNEFRAKAKGLPDLLTYGALIAPGVILQKDGSLLAAWELQGRDTDSATPDELANVSSYFNSAVKLLGTGWMIHVDAIRTPNTAYPPANTSHFPDPVTQLIDDERRAFFGRGLCYTTTTFLAVTYKPNYTFSKIKLKEGAVSLDILEKELRYFTEAIQGLEDALSPVMLRIYRLRENETDASGGSICIQSDLLAHLQQCLTGELHPVRMPETPVYLDMLLGSENLIGGIAPRLGEKYMAVISIDGLPQESWPAMLSDLDALPFPYRFSTRFICLDQYDAIKEVDSFRKGWKQQVHKFLDQFFPNPNARVNRDAALMMEDAEQAMTDVQSGLISAGYITSNIVLLHENEEILQDQARELRRTFQTLGFGCRIESINAVEAWLGTLPGNWYANLRRPLINTLNLADLLPLSAVWTGSKYAPCPFYPHKSPPLAVFTTDGSTPFWFNLHEGDLGHTFIVGPTGSGKSVFLGITAAQFRRYGGAGKPKTQQEWDAKPDEWFDARGNFIGADAQVFIFDKGMSMFALCKAAQGAHYNVGADDSLAFAPLQHSTESEAEMAWASEWLESLLELQGMHILPAHRASIHTALVTLGTNPDHMRSLSDFVNTVQDSQIKEALRHFTIKGAMAQLLDAQSDSLSISSFMCFEIEELMQKGDKNLLPVLTYLFHRIEKSLDGKPSLLILDEAWVMLGHPVFKAKIREWLKVFRKANCAVVLATQSLTDATRSGIFDVLVDSCPTKILLANHAARQDVNSELYESVGCNATEIAIIAEAIPKQDYYIIAPSGRRKVQLALGPRALAFIGASDRESITRIKQLELKHGQDNWPEYWLAEKGLSASVTMQPEG